MSGHSKWSTIKRQKGANDAKRGAMFTKVAREIAVAARAGGGDPDANYRLRLAIDKARSINMPADNIKRAIEKATGGGDEAQYEEIVYEGYGPGGVAVLVEAATDNRNRTAAEVRSIFAKTGGQLAGSGAVAWQFEARGLITVARESADADEVALAAIDAGAADVDTETDPIEIYTEPAELEAVRKALDAAGIEVDEAENAMVAKQTVSLDADHNDAMVERYQAMSLTCLPPTSRSVCAPDRSGASRASGPTASRSTSSASPIASMPVTRRRRPTR